MGDYMGNPEPPESNCFWCKYLVLDGINWWCTRHRSIEVCADYVLDEVRYRRIYGLRKYKKQIEGDAEIAKELQDGAKANSRTSADD